MTLTQREINQVADFLRNEGQALPENLLERAAAWLRGVKTFRGSARDTRCMAELVDGHLVIQIAADALASGARNSDYFFNAAENGTPLQISDESVFLESVVRALNNEQEDGSTPVLRMLDHAIEYVCEQGEDGIEEKARHG